MLNAAVNIDAVGEGGVAGCKRDNRLSQSRVLIPFSSTSSKDSKGGGIELVKPPENSEIGDKVYFEGPDYEREHPA